MNKSTLNYQYLLSAIAFLQRHRKLVEELQSLAFCIHLTPADQDKILRLTEEIVRIPVADYYDALATACVGFPGLGHRNSGVTKGLALVKRYVEATRSLNFAAVIANSQSGRPLVPSVVTGMVDFLTWLYQEFYLAASTVNAPEKSTSYTPPIHAFQSLECSVATLECLLKTLRTDGNLIEAVSPLAGVNFRELLAAIREYCEALDRQNGNQEYTYSESLRAIRQFCNQLAPFYNVKEKRGHSYAIKEVMRTKAYIVTDRGRELRVHPINWKLNVDINFVLVFHLYAGHKFQITLSKNRLARVRQALAYLQLPFTSDEETLQQSCSSAFNADTFRPTLGEQVVEIMRAAQEEVKISPAREAMAVAHQDRLFDFAQTYNHPVEFEDGTAMMAQQEASETVPYPEDAIGALRKSAIEFRQLIERLEAILSPYLTAPCAVNKLKAGVVSQAAKVLDYAPLQVFQQIQAYLNTYNLLKYLEMGHAGSGCLELITRYNELLGPLIEYQESTGKDDNPLVAVGVNHVLGDWQITKAPRVQIDFTFRLGKRFHLSVDIDLLCQLIGALDAIPRFVAIEVNPWAIMAEERTADEEVDKNAIATVLSAYLGAPSETTANEPKETKKDSAKGSAEKYEWFANGALMLKDYAFMMALAEPIRVEMIARPMLSSGRRSIRNGFAYGLKHDRREELFGQLVQFLDLLAHLIQDHHNAERVKQKQNETNRADGIDKCGCHLWPLDLSSKLFDTTMVPCPDMEFVIGLPRQRRPRMFIEMIQQALEKPTPVTTGKMRDKNLATHHACGFVLLKPELWDKLPSDNLETGEDVNEEPKTATFGQFQEVDKKEEVLNSTAESQGLMEDEICLWVVTLMGLFDLNRTTPVATGSISALVNDLEQIILSFLKQYNGDRSVLVEKFKERNVGNWMESTALYDSLSILTERLKLQQMLGKYGLI